MVLEDFSLDDQETIISIAEEYELEVDEVLGFMSNEYVDVEDLDDIARRYSKYWHGVLA